MFPKFLKILKSKSYVHSLLHVNSLFFTVPYRISHEKESFKVKTNSIIQLLSITTHLKALHISITLLQTSTSKFLASPSDFRQLFIVIDAICSVFMMMYLVWILWKKQACVFKLIQQTVQIGNHESVFNWRSLLGVSSILFPTFEVLVVQNQFNWGNIISVTEINESNGMLKLLLTLTRTVSYLIDVLGKIFFNSFEVFGLVIALSVYEVAVHFVTVLGKLESFEMGILHIESFKTFMTSTLTNLHVGPYMIILSIDTLTYYAQLPGLIAQFNYDGGLTTGQFHMTCYLVVCCMFWIVCAEVHRMVHDTIKAWVHYHQFRVPSYYSINQRFMMVTLSNECDTDPIAMSCRVFSVTYGFLTSMLGVLVTYAIIIYQFSFS